MNHCAVNKENLMRILDALKVKHWQKNTFCGHILYKYICVHYIYAVPLFELIFFTLLIINTVHFNASLSCARLFEPISMEL